MKKPLQNRLLEWYAANKRDLPWRHTDDPYQIMVSEFMLQQTQVLTVIEYYHRFIKRFPSVSCLAQADEAEVLKYWQGLGYYHRARNLHRAAGIIESRYNGHIPKDYDALIKLPGVGRYLTGAILSIAYNLPYPTVDGNVMRVIARIFGIHDTIDQSATQRTITDIVKKMIPLEQAGDFTQALMELGALVCTPKNPKCLNCPVNSDCFAFLDQKSDILPLKKKKTPVKDIDLWVLVLAERNRIVLEYRHHQTLLPNMWGLPVLEDVPRDQVQEACLSRYQIEIKPGKDLGWLTHTFTHQKWHMSIIECLPVAPLSLSQNLHWVDIDQLDGKAVPVAFQKVLRKLFPSY